MHSHYVVNVQTTAYPPGFLSADYHNLKRRSDTQSCKRCRSWPTARGPLRAARVWGAAE